MAMSWEDAVRSLEPWVFEGFHCRYHSTCRALAYKDGFCPCDRWLRFRMTFGRDCNYDQRASCTSFEDCKRFLLVVLRGMEYDYYIYHEIDHRRKVQFILHFDEARDAKEARARLARARLENIVGGSTRNVKDSGIHFEENHELLLPWKGGLELQYSCCMKDILETFLGKDCVSRVRSSTATDVVTAFTGSDRNAIGGYLVCELERFLNLYFMTFVK